MPSSRWTRPRHPFTVTDNTGQSYTISTNTFANAIARTPAPGLNGYSGYQLFANDAYSIYHALQSTVSRRWGQNYFQAAYTFSKNIDATSTGNTAFNTAYNDQSNINASRGISDFNRPHRLAVSYAYDLPFFAHATGVKKAAFGGWQISGVSIFQSGVPFSIFDSGAGNGIPGTGQHAAIGSEPGAGSQCCERTLEWRHSPARCEWIFEWNSIHSGTAALSHPMCLRSKFLHDGFRRSGTQRVPRAVPAKLGCVVPQAFQNWRAAGSSLCCRLLQHVEPHELRQSYRDGYRSVLGRSQRAVREDRTNDGQSAADPVLAAVGFLELQMFQGREARASRFFIWITLLNTRNYLDTNPIEQNQSQGS